MAVGTGTYELPTEMCGGYFIVDVWLDGKGPWPMLLDSGAGRTLVDPRVLDAAAVGSTTDSLRIGRFSAHDLRVESLEMTELSAALGRDVLGIVGHPVFRDVLQTWDVAAGRITLRHGSLDPGETGVWPTRPGDRPFVASVVETDTVWVLLDTGSSRGLTLRSLDRLQRTTPLETTGARVRVDGVHLVRTARVASDVRVGPIVVETPVVNNSVSVDLVGQEVLRFVRLTFDQRNDLVRFEAIDGRLHDPVRSPPVRSLGFAVHPAGAAGEVIHLFEGRAPPGLEVGDLVREIDGVAWGARGCRAWPLGQADDTPPRDVDLTVQRGDSIFEVTAVEHRVHVDEPPAGGWLQRPRSGTRRRDDAP